MKKNKTVKPTQAELEILRVLWDKGTATVREVHGEVSPEGKTGYTTTLKLMQNMLEKGLLTRDESTRTHIYSPAIREEEVQKSLLGGFLNTAFGGSAKKLVMQALGNHETSPEELDEIRHFLDKIEKAKK